MSNQDIKQHQLINDEYYNNLNQYYDDELTVLDLKIKYQLSYAEFTHTNDPFEQFKGLIISKSEVDSILLGEQPTLYDNKGAEEILIRISQLEQMIATKLHYSNENNIFLPLEYLSDLFNLTYIEKQCIIMCLAIELDRKYEKLYGFLQDDIHLKRPTLDLILKFCCSHPHEQTEYRKLFSKSDKLHRYFFTIDSHPHTKTTSLATELALDERVIQFLLGNDTTDVRLAPIAQLCTLDDDIPPLIIGNSFQHKLRTCMDLFLADELEERNIAINIYGTEGSGRKTQLIHLCKHYEQNVFIVNMKLLIQNDIKLFKGQLQLIVREAIFQNAILAFEHTEELFLSDDSSTYFSAFLFELQFYVDILFFISNDKLHPTEFFSRYAFQAIELPAPGFDERLLLWQVMSEAYPISKEVDWVSISNKFRFTPGQIENTLRSAKYLMNWEENVDSITNEYVIQGCYRQIDHKLENKARRLTSKYNWGDLVLPKEEKQLLRNACNQVKYRHKVYGEWGFDKKLSYGKGLSMLFAGPPGTGKTMSAEIVANELNLEIYKVDLSQVMSKYIGETEKNLKEIFDEANRSHAILFFDETDALFGKRSEVKDSKDKYANIEVSYLLQKMEEYDGITILATNYLQNIDDAFMRRINYVINYPFPDAKERVKLWETMIPKETPLSDDIDFTFLGETFKIAGGNIKNIIVSGAFLAAENSEPLSMKHLLIAAKYELQKTGIVILKNELGEYTDLLF